MYQIELRHSGLNKYRVIKGLDPYAVKQKAICQQAIWDEQWEKKQARLEAQQTVRSGAERAIELTQAAQEAVEELRNLLAASIKINHAVDWEKQKDNSPFRVPRPTIPGPFDPPPSLQPPRKPLPTDPENAAKISFWAKLIPELRSRAEEKAAEKYVVTLANWETETQRRAKQLSASLAEHASRIAQLKELQAEWDKKKFVFRAEQLKKNALVDSRHSAYNVGRADSVEDYCELVLSTSEYPDYFPQDYDLAFAESTRTLVVDYQLPAPDKFPRLKEVKFVKSRNELQEVPLKESDRQRLYDDVIYKVLLRILHELFAADVAKHVQVIALNGWVTSVDRATGVETHACIASIHVQREEFVGLNLAEVDPKSCFRKLKGVGSSQLHSVTPVPPIMSMSTSDKRFVQSHLVTDKLAEGSNLAAMEWEEFEHLVREIFEKEFAKDGAEVKVTRASRDGGVDAVVFNPDPLRGGKTVIQAKRYVNTVGVSAVRDLYGTLMNEGAGKGILVTTADFGPDAYEFIKNKPLVLLNGAQLLYLLQQHGYKGRIDLEEARRLDQAEKASRTK